MKDETKLDIALLLIVLATLFLVPLAATCILYYSSIFRPSTFTAIYICTFIFWFIAFFAIVGWYDEQEQNRQIFGRIRKDIEERRELRERMLEKLRKEQDEET
ncbi:MAG: hypothetical protein ABSD73_00215 [Candidatus Bathyarchaeia archaeon]